MPAVRLVSSRFRSCTNLTLRPTIVVFGLGIRLHVRMRTKLEFFVTNSNHRFCEWIFIDQVEFEAAKTLSGRRARRCDKNQFLAKVTLCT